MMALNMIVGCTFWLDPVRLLVTATLVVPATLMPVLTSAVVPVVPDAMLPPEASPEPPPEPTATIACVLPFDMAWLCCGSVTVQVVVAVAVSVSVCEC